MNLDDNVLIAIADWDDHQSTGQAVTYAREIALAIGQDVGKVARAVDRLAKGGFIEAHDITSMGSPYPEHMITGISSYGKRVADHARSGAGPSQTGPVTINVYGAVGSLNTGQIIGNISANLNVAMGPSVDELREAVKRMVEAIEPDRSIDDRVKAEILENIEALSAQAQLLPRIANRV